MAPRRTSESIRGDDLLRVLTGCVLSLWLAGAASRIFRDGLRFDAALVTLFSLGLLWATWRRSRVGDRIAGLLSLGCWLVFAAWVVYWQVDFAVWMLAGSGLLAMVCLVWSLARHKLARLPGYIARVLYLAVLALFTYLGILFAHDGLRGIPAPYTRRAVEHPAWPGLGVEWPMHVIDNPGSLLPNGLGPGDVNGDGYQDYVTNYEARGFLRVAFHPGEGLIPGVSWPARQVGRVGNAEGAAMSDLDRDGALDVVVAHGVESRTFSPGVRIFWGLTGSGQALALYTWFDGGDLPASQGGWHFLTIRPADLDGDGDLDLVAGGRASRGAFGSKETIYEDPSLVWAGIRWFENPGGDASSIRNLADWRAHTIDAASRSGHGFELGDLDRDGDLDLVNANSDFDTPEEEEDVAWYQNPGAAITRVEAWPRHELLRSDEFYAKEQVLIADLDGDGWEDILVHAPQRLYGFRNLGEAVPASERFEAFVIDKHPAAVFRARALEAADLDGDGDLELVGALIHQDGSLPGDKAAVFYMDRSGEAWATRVIKWGDGFWGLNFVNGEKWDQLLPYDVDGDGDLDIVANVEEYNRLRAVLAVVWFENPGLK